MEIIMKKVGELVPYENNPRINDISVDAVANSIEQFGFKVPMVVDNNNVVITGHTRLKAAIKLGIEEVPCIIADDLDEEQVKAFRIADNSVGADSQWDMSKLKKELDGIKNFDMGDFKIDFDKLSQELLEPTKTEKKYTTKVDIPQYEIQGENPKHSELYDLTRYNQLVAEINATEGLDEDEKQFLLYAASRHIVFNYQNIAEHYAHMEKDVQELMENSALVYIDFDDAIKNGYTKLQSAIEAAFLGDEDDEA